MATPGVIRVLQRERTEASPTEQLLVETQARLQSAQMLILVGQDLTGFSDLEGLRERAVSYLRDDLAYKGADITLVMAPNDETVDLHRQSSGVFTMVGTAQIGVPVRLGQNTLGEIMIPLNDRDQLTDADRETLKTFSCFLAVGISNVRRLEDARALASIDPLTGVMNRRRLFEIGREQLAREGSTGLIVFDIDRLKTINDTFGHLAGDALLKSVGERAKECIRKTDVLVRYGGDEFVILLPNAGFQHVREIAERVRANIESTSVEWSGQVVRSTVSVGLACVEGDVDLHALLGQADTALYAAKESGRNLVCS